MHTVELHNEKLKPVFLRYGTGNTAIRLLDSNNNPYTTCTINLPDMDLETNQVAVKNYSENEGMLDALLKAEIVQEPLRFVRSGSTVIPICNLTKPASVLAGEVS